MAAFVGRAEAARILRVTEDQVVALSRAGHLGQVRRGQGGGFVWDRVAILAYARTAEVTEAGRSPQPDGQEVRHAPRPGKPATEHGHAVSDPRRVTRSAAAEASSR